jgi:polyribonucleotide nucleotidyltransferase
MDGRLAINPTFSDLDRSQLDLVVASTNDAIVMVEAGASEVSEELMLDGIRYGHEVSQTLIELQQRMVREIGRPKMAFEEATHDHELEEALQAWDGQIEPVLLHADRFEREQSLEQLKSEAMEELGERFAPTAIAEDFDNEVKRVMRSLILNRGVRVGGRSLNDLRPISAQVGVLPRTHGLARSTVGALRSCPSTLSPVG